MFRSDAPTNYEEVYQDLVDKLAGADFKHAVACLGAKKAGHDVALDVLGRTCLVGPDGVKADNGEHLDFTIRICAAYYLLHAGNGELSGDWVSYRDFPDGAFFHAAFSQIVEEKIANDFSGRLAKIDAAAKALAGSDLDAGLGGDRCIRFPALPQVPLALVYYDQDEEFPASAKVLYDRNAPLFLDMECLAVLGLILADGLAAAGS